MKFFNIDFHISVILDVANIFSNIGHEVVDWSLSGHAKIVGKKKKDILLNDGSKFIGCTTPEICDKFYDTYKDELSKYDGFIACYPSEFAMLYEKWNKPIIIYNCTRLEYPTIQIFKNFLHRMKEKKLLWYVCNNKGDIWYTKYFTGIDGIHIPNFCEYVGFKRTGIIKRFIIHERSYIENIPNNCHSLSRLRNDKWVYSWKDVYRHRGIVHNPYNNGSMTIFENYTGNMPMLFPSKKFIKDLYYRKQSLDSMIPNINNLNDFEDVNNPLNIKNSEILDKWIEACDFYDKENMPYIQYFDDWDHLNKLVETIDTNDISKKMKEYNMIRKNKIYYLWKKILDEIQEMIK